MFTVHIRAIGCIGTICQDGRCCACPICEPPAEEECCNHGINLHTAAGCAADGCPCY